MSHPQPETTAECTIQLSPEGMDRFHQFLEETWTRVRQHVDVHPESEFAVTLMLGELIANVAGHAYAGMPEDDRLLRIRIEASPRCIRGEVRDHGLEFEGAPERLRAAALDDGDLSHESGRGLRILTTLADSVRYHRTPSGENVWLILKCDPGSDEAC
jgi:anti-sigma regulatory factor (Ser/Thr protein kinase)